MGLIEGRAALSLAGLEAMQHHALCRWKCELSYDKSISAKPPQHALVCSVLYLQAPPRHSDQCGVCTRCDSLGCRRSAARQRSKIESMMHHILPSLLWRNGTIARLKRMGPCSWLLRYCIKAVARGMWTNTWSPLPLPRLHEPCRIDLSRQVLMIVDPQVPLKTLPTHSILTGRRLEDPVFLACWS